MQGRQCQPIGQLESGRFASKPAALLLASSQDGAMEIHDVPEPVAFPFGRSRHADA